MIAAFGRVVPFILLLSLLPLLHAYDAAVHLEWAASLRNLQTQPTLQVVVNPLLLRHVPQSKAVFESLALLGASTVRFVPWLPYPGSLLQLWSLHLAMYILYFIFNLAFL